MAPIVVLVGAPGSGKSTVGQAVADQLEVTFRDTDADIERTVGRSISDQFVQDGEAAFRVREEEAVASALVEHDGVLSLGGGAVLSAATRALLMSQQVVWLQVSASEASTRVGLAASRPLLMGNVRSRLVALLAERAPLYTEVASLTVNTDGREPSDVVSDVVQWLNGQTS
ncbi:MAG: shikimate kinase [Actinomycetes bacterium]